MIISPKSGPHPFGDVVELLREHGASAFRHAWQHDRMACRIVLVPGSEIPVEPHRPLGKAMPDAVGETRTYLAHFDVAWEDGRVEMWSPTHSDILADDWYMLDPR